MIRYCSAWILMVGVLAVTTGCQSDKSDDSDAGGGDDTGSEGAEGTSEDDTEGDSATGSAAGSDETDMSTDTDMGTETETVTQEDDSATQDSASETGHDTETAVEGSDAGTDTETTVGPDSGTAGDSETEETSKDYTVAAFGYEDPEPSGFHPLGVAHRDLIRQEEAVFIAGDRAADQWWEDDAVHDGLASPLGVDLPSDSTPILAKAGDLNGDSVADLVVVSHSADVLSVSVMVGGRDAFLSSAGGFDLYDAGDSAGAIRLAVGDVDGDRRDELALTNGHWLRVYDDAEMSFTLMDEVFSDAAFDDMDLAAGNFDDDDAYELALLHTGPGSDALGIDIYDDAGHDFAVEKAYPASQFLPTSGDADSKWQSGGALAVGNTDDDPADELYALFVSEDVGGGGNTESRGWLLDDVAGAGTVLTTVSHGNEVIWPRKALVHPLEFAFADFNGDGVNELCEAYYESEQGWRFKVHSFKDDVQVKVANDLAFSSYEDGEMPLRLAAVDGDALIGEALIAAFGPTGSPVTTVRIAATRNETSDINQSSFTVDFKDAPAVHEDTITRVPLVVAGDFDGDSFKVRYTGEHWLSLPAPRPVVVMAAPPIRAGIQNEVVTETAYGTEVSQGSSATHEIETTNSATMSFETSTLTGLIHEFGGLLGGSLSNTVTKALAESNTTTEVVTYGTSYSGAYPDDYVVFIGVLHHVYAYEVESASAAETIGDRLTIDLPVSVKTYKWTLDYFNSVVNPELRIGPETFTHQAGAPETYPSPAALNGFPGWQSTPRPVGQGGGSTTTTITFTEENANEEQRTITNEKSYGIAVAGEGYDASQAVSRSSVFVSVAGKSTSYQGTVGDIADTEDYARYSYDFEMFVYTFEQPNGRRFQVINYATSNLGPGYSE